MRTRIAGLGLLWLGLVVGPVAGHFNMLLPQTSSAKKGESVALTYQWGHPFEHQLFDAPQPDSLVVLRPEGATTDLRGSMEKVAVSAAEGKTAQAYRCVYKPLTRPYGLEPGMVFQAQLPAPAAGLVEIERYNPTPPENLPPDEQITRTARTDPNGVVTATLTDPGWWSLTAGRDGGTRPREGKSYPLRQRTTLWVHVDDKTSNR